MLTQIEYRIIASPNLDSFTMVLESVRVLFGVWNPVAKMYVPLMNCLKNISRLLYIGSNRKDIQEKLHFL